MSTRRTESPAGPDSASKLPPDLVFQIIGAVAAIATIVYVMVQLL